MSGFKNLNCPIAKSLLLAACMPSRPAIPTPTSAFMIMETSLAPSPIARVVFLGKRFFTKLTTSPFCYGVTRHAITTSLMSDKVKNSCKTVSSLWMTPKDSPVTIRAVEVQLKSSILLKSSITCFIRSLIYSSSLCSITRMSMFFSKRPAE